jgi:hypothetical protein
MGILTAAEVVGHAGITFPAANALFLVGKTWFIKKCIGSVWKET